MTVDNALSSHSVGGKHVLHSVDKKCGQMCRKMSVVIRMSSIHVRDSRLVFQQFFTKNPPIFAARKVTDSSPESLSSDCRQLATIHIGMWIRC
jgi:hypothetical protein